MNFFVAVAAIAILAMLMLLILPPRTLATALRAIIPLCIALFGVGLLFSRNFAMGAMAIVAAASVWKRLGGSPVGSFGSAKPAPQGRSSVRSAALEMELDHDSGAMNGMVLVGQYEGHELDALSQDELLILHTEIISDGESLALLEAYLDRRFPAWREDAEPNADPGQGGATGSGSMSEQEAYEVLGLASGASAAEIRKAHRRLMKTAHPDSGGSTFLAAKINEAKDILLRGHS